MKLIVLFVITIVFCLHSCQVNSREDNNPKKEVLIKTHEKFKNCFKEIDSNTVINSIGCNFGIYGLISDKYVIEIKSNIFNEYNNVFNVNGCISYSIEENNLNCTLFIFNDKEANLRNLCTDLIIIPNPESIRKIQGINGELKGLSEKHKITSLATFELNNLVFLDSLDGKVKEIKFDKLTLWEVKNLGTPG